MTGAEQSQGRGGPLQGCRILDFTTLLPGPFATRLLYEAGAEVIKIERAGQGDELRAGSPAWGDTSLGFALMNAGKRSIAVDLKCDEQKQAVLALMREADVIVEQFRPGVMDRLGLGYEAARRMNPQIIYCSITGYGQEGPSAQVAGHDLTYMAETGLLSLTGDAAGVPVLPPVLVADIGAGTLPAVVNILLALRHRDTHGEGAYLDISLTDNLFSFPYWAVSRGVGYGQWPVTGGERLTGGTPRYQLYRAKDGRYIAAAPLEQRFWEAFCRVIGLDAAFRDDSQNPQATYAAVAEIIARHDSSYWRDAFAGKDVCAAVVNTLSEAAAHPHFRSRGLFERRLHGGAHEAPDVVLPLVARFRRPASEQAVWPALGEANTLLDES